MRAAALRIVPLLSVFILACGGGGGDPTEPTPVPPTPTIGITAQPSSLTVVQGQSGTVKLTLARGGGYEGSVTLSASGAPSGVQASISPSPITGSTTSATVTVTASAAAAPGSYQITITASASGVTGVSDQFQITVVAAPAFTIEASPAAHTVNAGASAISTISIARTNISDAITLSLLDPPAGISASFNAASVTGNSSEMTIAANESTVPGNYTLTVNGAAGTLQSSTQVALTVNPVPSFTVTAPTTPLELLAGGDGDVANLSITRTNFTGDISFTALSLPDWLSVVIDPVTNNGTSAVAAISARESAVPGNYIITAEANSSIGKRTFTIPVHITLPFQGTMVDWYHCDASQTMAWFAYRDGESGGWTTVTGVSENGRTRYTFPIMGNTGAVAYSVRRFLPADPSPSNSRYERISSSRTPRDESGNSSATYQYHFTANDANGMGECEAGWTSSVMSVSTTGLVPTDRLRIAGRNGISPSFSTSNSSRDIFATNGISDYWVVKYTQTSADDIWSQIRRGVSSPGSMSIDAAAMVPATKATFTMNGLTPQHGVFDEMHVITSRGPVGPMYLEAVQNLSTRRIFSDAASQSGDMYRYLHLATRSSGGTIHSLARFQLFGSAVYNVTASLPSELTFPSITATTGGTHPRLTVSGTLPAEYNRDVRLDITSPSFPFNQHVIVASSEWLATRGSRTSFALQMLDLSGTAYPAEARLVSPTISLLTASGGRPFTVAPIAGTFVIETSVRTLGN